MLPILRSVSKHSGSRVYGRDDWKESPLAAGANGTPVFLSQDGVADLKARRRGSGLQENTNSCTRWRRWKTPVSMHLSSSKIQNSSPELSPSVTALKNRRGVLRASSMLGGRRGQLELYPSLSTMGSVVVLSRLPEPLWVRTLS